MRALAVGAVIAYHAFPRTLPGGYLGVDVFFVISGFLITGMMLDGIRARRFSLLDFYLRRVRRILPALLTMLVGVSLLALLILMPDEMERFASNVTAGALFVPNLLLAREQGYFDAAATDNPLLHLWSLGVEEQFYLLWPAALMLFVPRVRVRTTVIVIVTIIMLSLALNIAMARYAPNASFYLPFTRFWQLLTGALLAALATARALRADDAGATALEATERTPWKSDAMSVAGLVLVCAAMLAARAVQGAQVALAFPVTLGTALFIAAGPRALFNRTLFSWRPVVYVGLISYPLYLWHWPPLSFLHIMDLNQGTGGRLLRVAAVLFAVIAAVLTYHLVEKPIRRRKELRRLGVRLVGGLGVAAIAGAVVGATGGLPQRTQLTQNPFYRTDAMRREDRCSRMYGQPAALLKNAFCVRNDYEHDPRIVILGDSHSNMLVPAVESAYPGVSTLQIGASACTYLRNTEFWNDNRLSWRAICPQIVAGAWRSIGPSTRVVILAARIPMYTATPAEYAATYDYVSPKHFVSPEFPGASPSEVYERALARDLRALLAAGHEVVLVLPVPSLDFSPRSCLRFRPVERWMDAPDPDRCSMPRARVEAQLGGARALVNRVARAIDSADLHVVDPMEALCDASRCRAVIDGRLLYRDDNHLSDDGARYVWSRIQPRALRGLAPEQPVSRAAAIPPGG
ncbi:MAG TPA: acyltransferase family protein [Steroidobacteraceae bacterium]|nr:acyltransferase family protein [Steroidobacteraceae bacterium]